MYATTFVSLLLLLQFPSTLKSSTFVLVFKITIIFGEVTHAALEERLFLKCPSINLVKFFSKGVEGFIKVRGLRKIVSWGMYNFYTQSMLY